MLEGRLQIHTGYLGPDPHDSGILKETCTQGRETISLSGLKEIACFFSCRSNLYPQEGSKDKATRTKSHQTPSRREKQLVETLAAIFVSFIRATSINLQMQSNHNRLMQRPNL